MKTILARRCIRTGLSLCVKSALVWTDRLYAEERSVDSKLEGFNEYMAKLLKDWNAPGLVSALWSRTNWSSPRATATGTRPHRIEQVG